MDRGKKQSKSGCTHESNSERRGRKRKEKERERIDESAVEGKLKKRKAMQRVEGRFCSFIALTGHIVHSIRNL